MADQNSIQLARNNIVALLERQKPQITMALPKHLTADRLCRVAVTEMSKNPKLYECTPTSILAAIIISAQMGWEVGVSGQSYLVPYWDNKQKLMKCQLIPGWQGIADLVARAGRASVWTGAVRQGDFFDWMIGANPKLEHKPGDDDTSEFTRVYAVGWIQGAERPIIEVWSRAKVMSHLKAYNKVGDLHYALQNENNLEMYGRKVALLQVMKYMPKSVEIQTAQSLTYRGEEGQQNLTISDSGVIDAEYVDMNENATAAIDAASTRTEQVKAAIQHRSKKGQQPEGTPPAAQQSAPAAPQAQPEPSQAAASTEAKPETQPAKEPAAQAATPVSTPARNAKPATKPEPNVPLDSLFGNQRQEVKQGPPPIDSEGW